MINRENEIAVGEMNAFHSHLEKMFADGGDKIFALLTDGPLTYADCRREMYAYARIFAQIDLSRGHRVMILSRHDRATITLFLALLLAGITPVIADSAATLPECLELIKLCRADAIFVDTGHPLAAAVIGLNPIVRVVELGASGLADEARIDARSRKSFDKKNFQKEHLNTEEIALLVLTSGTTSTPKAVSLTFENLSAQLNIFQAVYGFDAHTRLLNTLPLHHVDGLIRGPLAALWVGGSVHRPIPFSVQSVSRMLASVAHDGVTHLITVPAMLRIIERVGRDEIDAFRTSQFRFVISSADLLEPALWQRVEATFGVKVVNAYGLSEVVCDALFAGPDDETRKIGTLGRPVGCEARVVDDAGREVSVGEVGELVLSGPTVTPGYFCAPEATAMVLKDGDFHTGDYVRFDVDGIYEFIGRKKTAIVSAGFTIHPETATQVLSAMPGVVEAIAFGVPDPTIGERLVAAIVVAPGEAITSDQAAAYCRLSLSPERCPREFHIVELLPRGASGKVIISELTSWIEKDLALPPNQDVLSVAASCFNVPAGQLSFASTPFNTSGWDSLAHMTLIESLEMAFGIQFSAVQIVQIMSLGDAHRFIGEALSTANSSTR